MDKSYPNEQRKGYVCKGTARAKTRKWEWWGWPRTHLTKGHHLLCWGVRHLGEKSNAEKRPKWSGHCRVCAKYSALVWFIPFVSCCPKSHRCCLSFRRFTVQPKSREAKRGKAGSLQLKTGGPEPLGGGQQVTVCSREKEETNSNAGTQCSGDRGQQICP